MFDPADSQQIQVVREYKKFQCSENQKTRPYVRVHEGTEEVIPILFVPCGTWVPAQYFSRLDAKL